jgi:hypothetical protein
MILDVEIESCEKHIIPQQETVAGVDEFKFSISKTIGTFK